MSIKNTISDTFRLLTFQITEQEMAGFTRAHLIFGLVCTWLVGIGRYWDDPKAGILQHLGVGSVIYVFVLAFVLWVLVYPLRPKNWSYFHILTFISLVSPPAALYAIPVENFLSLNDSRSVNAWFLLIVAALRVALLMFFLYRFARLGWLKTLTATVLPITAIVWVLAMLNLERAVFDIMGGFREGTSKDSAYGLLIVIVLFSTVLLPVSLISYLVLAYLSYVKNPDVPESVFPREPAEPES